MSILYKSFMEALFMIAKKQKDFRYQGQEK